MFVTNRDIYFYTNEVLLNPTTVESIAFNTSVASIYDQTENRLRCKLKKEISFLRVTSILNYRFVPMLNMSDEFLHQSISNASYPYDPDFVLFQDLTDFSSIFDNSSNICIHSKFKEHKTLITCYAISSIRKSMVGIISFLTNIKTQFQDEILYSIGQIKEL